MTKAVDTNVVIRLLIDDGSKEVMAARTVFERETVEISLTVMLECEWALRSVYKFGRAAICEALGALLTLENVVLPQHDLVATAIEAHRLGLDFADACHLLSAESADELLTFDEMFQKRALRMVNAIPVRIPLHTA